MSSYNKRAQSANANTGKQRQRKKYTKSVEINVNICHSRIGRATAQMYIPISNAQKEQEKREQGQGVDAKKMKKLNQKEVMPGLKALRSKRAQLANQPEVTAEEIEEHFEKLEKRIAEEQAERKALANQKEIYKAQQQNKLLRYHEWLILNRKGHTQAFKSITRGKRDSLFDGTGVAYEPKPCPGQYRPRFSQVDKELNGMKIASEKEMPDKDKLRRLRQTLTKAEQGIVCNKILYTYGRENEHAPRRRQHHLRRSEVPYEDKDKGGSGSLWINNQGRRNRSGDKQKSELNIEVGGSAVKKAKLTTIGGLNPKDRRDKQFDRNMTVGDLNMQVDIRGKKAVERSNTVKVAAVTAESVERSVSIDEAQHKRSRQVESNLKKLGSTIGSKNDGYRRIHKDVNLKQEKRGTKFDPYLPFQNVKICKDYYFVPTQNPKSSTADPNSSSPIGLTIEKIGNPSCEERQPVRPVVFQVSDAWISRDKKPTDRSTVTKLTERQQMVLYPVKQSRHGKKFRDHDMTECLSSCNLHASTKGQTADITNYITTGPLNNTQEITHDGMSHATRLRSAQSIDQRSVKSKKEPMTLQLPRTDFTNSGQLFTQADYDPNYGAVERSLALGTRNMDTDLSRVKMPIGRPINTPNLIELPSDYSRSINVDKVNEGLSQLAHNPQTMKSPNMSMVRGRDLGFYRQTEAIFNVIRENENLKLLTDHSKSRESTQALRCHGFNSIKDYLTMTKAESEALLEWGDAGASDHSRFRQQVGFQTQSGILNSQLYDSQTYKRSKKNRPQTGVPIGSKRSGDMAAIASLKSD